MRALSKGPCKYTCIGRTRRIHGRSAVTQRVSDRHETVAATAAAVAQRRTMRLARDVLRSFFFLEMTQKPPSVLSSVRFSLHNSAGRRPRRTCPYLRNRPLSSGNRRFHTAVHDSSRVLAVFLYNVQHPERSRCRYAVLPRFLRKTRAT